MAAATGIGTVTKERLEAAVRALAAVAEAIRDAGSVPSGALYAALLTYGIDLQTYERIVGILVRAKLVSESGHVLTWIGRRDV